VVVKHLINDRATLVEEMLEGLVCAYQGTVIKVPDVNGIVKCHIEEGKVALLVGGGSGHEPIYHGLVGKNMADAAAVGNIFASPNPRVIYETAKACQRGNGVLFLYGNYAGDVMNFDIAAEMLHEDGIRVRTVVINDDVATQDKENRRGISGLFFAVKIAGSVCASVKDLDAVAEIVQKAVDRTRSMGTAFEAGTMLNTGKPTFTLQPNEIEIGMGIHGEPGVEVAKTMPAKQLIQIMLKRILSDLPFKRGDEVAVLLNDLGSVTNMELCIANKTVAEVLSEAGLLTLYTHIGKVSTTMDMRGFSISLIQLDDELKQYFFADANSLAFDFHRS